MHKYKVTLGKDSREFEAANKREALRRFGTADPSAKVEVIEANLPDPPKRRYSVTWGAETREVEAVHEDDAWSQFIGGNENSIVYKNPNLYERIVKDLGPVNPEDESAEEVEDEGGSDAGTQTTATAVSSLNAPEAKDHISRMRSADALQKIIDNDERVTVKDAARQRLTEIGGS
jgi:hypothetical protein